jgi:hypothetical protein
MSGKFPAIVAGAALWALSLATVVNAQQIVNGRNTDIIDALTTMTVRNVDDIRTDESDGRVFSSFVAQDVRNRKGDLIIPKSSEVELIVRRLPDNEMELDLDSVTVNGQRFGLDTGAYAIESKSNCPGATDKPTIQYAGSNPMLGTFLTGMAGNAEGTAQTNGACIVVRGGTQLMTRGSSIAVPAESLLTFRLVQPLRADVYDDGYMRAGVHYHHVPGQDQVETQQAYRQKPGASSNAQGVISVRGDKNVVWQASESGNVYVQVDNGSPRFFASGLSGTQPAPGMTPGHRYTFTLQDANGNVIAQDQVDLTH